jgi:hypothetical protein
MALRARTIERRHHWDLRMIRTEGSDQLYCAMQLATLSTGVWRLLRTLAEATHTPPLAASSTVFRESA